jgi:hypothetical protein
MKPKEVGINTVQVFAVPARPPPPFFNFISAMNCHESLKSLGRNIFGKGRKPIYSEDV